MFRCLIILEKSDLDLTGHLSANPDPGVETLPQINLAYHNT